MTSNCAAFVSYSPSLLHSTTSLSKSYYCTNFVERPPLSNPLSCTTNCQRRAHCQPRCAAVPDSEGGTADREPSQPPRQEDWRTFRARLVRNENPASTVPTSPPSSQVPSPPPSTSQSSSHSQLWAHHIPFVEPGSLLLASPEHFKDEQACTFFANTAILILEHSNLGSIGLIINRPISVKLNTAVQPSDLTDTPSIQVPGIYRQPQPHLQHLESSESSVPTNPSEQYASESDLAILNDAPLFNGGPVRLDTLALLHGDPEFGDVITGSIRTAPFHSAVARYRKGALPGARFFVGYTGWASGQLDQEIEQGVWYTCACCDQLLLTHWSGGTDLHRVVLPLMGGHYAQVANALQQDDNK